MTYPSLSRPRLAEVVIGDLMAAYVSSRAKPPSKAPLSLIALQIVRESLAPEASLPELAKLAASDPAFALRIIALVNSASFGPQRHVSDVRQAVSLVGIRGLRSIGMSLALSDMIPVGDDGRVLLANSLRRAVASQFLAQRLGQKEVDEYFTTGLFLEVGLLARARDDLPGAAEVARLPALHRVVHERAAGIMEHPAAGAVLAATFMVPAHVEAAVLQHHAETIPEALPSRVAWAAERLAALWEGGDPAANRKAAIDAMLKLGLSADDTQQATIALPELLVAAATGFDRDIGPQPSVEELLVDVNRSLVEMTQNYDVAVRRLEALLAEKELVSKQFTEANAQLQTLASTDALTGLANKRAFEEALQRDLSRADRDHTWLTIVMSDIDFFKKINDTYGHPVGDDVLREVGRVFGSKLRGGDLAARYGGEEFVLILPGSNSVGGKLAAERLRRAIEALRVNGSFSVTASFGVASVCGPGCANNMKDVISRADSALYAAKRGGRNRVVAADAELVAAGG
ncbi:MAG: diguanylate cyclase [Pseudomonadota bacterium]